VTDEVAVRVSPSRWRRGGVHVGLHLGLKPLFSDSGVAQSMPHQAA
jgi:hypothetical protein